MNVEGHETSKRFIPLYPLRFHSTESQGSVAEALEALEESGLEEGALADMGSENYSPASVMIAPGLDHGYDEPNIEGMYWIFVLQTTTLETHTTKSGIYLKTTKSGILSN